MKTEQKMILLERCVEEAKKHLGMLVKEVNDLMHSDSHSYYL